MCSITLFADTSGYRVFMNRDERHDRTPERPPQLLDITHGITAPIDPQSGGTWIAHNKHGYWGCILNGYAEGEHEQTNASQSRGVILPTLLAAQNPLNAAQHFDPTPFASFTLLIGSPMQHHLFAWDTHSYAEQSFHASKNDNIYFHTSSSWMQPQLIEVRKAIFQMWADAPSFCKNGMPTLHYSKEPDPQSAIMMSRSYSRTQSITHININASGCSMTYEAIKRV